MPVFALANTGIIFPGKWTSELLSANSLGIILGLIIGKPVGILIFCYTAVKLKISQLGEDIKWSYIFGASLLGGIGFTMSIFITLLAFDDVDVVANSKIAVLTSSLLAGLSGYLFLKYAIKTKSSINGNKYFK
jgi:NhaA family Na+:H+ antiporter